MLLLFLKKLVFTGDFSKVCNITVHSSLLMKSNHSQQSDEKSSVHEYHVTSANINSYECSSLKYIHHEFATIYGIFVECLIKEACAFFNKDTTSWSSRLNGINEVTIAIHPRKLMRTLSLATL